MHFRVFVLCSYGSISTSQWTMLSIYLYSPGLRLLQLRSLGVVPMPIGTDSWLLPQIAKFMWPTWGLPGSCRPHVGPMNLAIRGSTSAAEFADSGNHKIYQYQSKKSEVWIWVIRALWNYWLASANCQWFHFLLDMNLILELTIELVSMFDKMDNICSFCANI